MDSLNISREPAFMSYLPGQNLPDMHSLALPWSTFYHHMYILTFSSPALTPLLNLLPPPLTVMKKYFEH